VTLRIAVVGTGYLGAVHAAGMAELGFDVVGVDVDEAKVDALRAGKAPFFEPDLQPLLERHVASGALRFSTDFASVTGSDVVFICVGTPQRADGLAADMTYVYSSVEAVAPHLSNGALVVGKSTVPVGTATALADRLDSLAPAGSGAELAWNPEFLRESFAVEDTLRPDRLVFGVTSEGAEERLREVYATALEADTPLIVTDLATSELVKVSANAFLATKISFINAIAEICEITGANVTQLADAIGFDERIGRKFLNAGIGFGGGCLPKDIRAFMARAGEIGAGQSLAFLGEVDAINLRRRDHVVNMTRELLGGEVADRRVAVLGAAFKPNSDDVRDSPALAVAGALHLAGAHVTVYDPEAAENAAKIYPTLEYGTSAMDVCRGAEVVLHLTEWKEFRALDPVELGAVVSTKAIIDGRNCLDTDAYRRAGWTFRAMGRP